MLTWLMKPIINMEEQPGRTVGTRMPPADAFAAAMRLQESTAEYAASFGHLPLPKGVFRFRTHEEADAWMMRELARRAQG